MQIKWLVSYACAVLIGTGSLTTEAHEVTLRHNGLTLNADLTLATGKPLAAGVILITHGGLAHRGMESLMYIQRLLNDKGYSALSINLSLGLDNRHGMYDCQVTHRHRDTDAAGEIGVWMDWLTQQGAKHVTLLGHSRGGAQTALYAAEHDNSLVDSIVLLAPAVRENTSAAEYQRRFQQPLAPLLEKANQWVDHGKGDTLLEHIGLLNCPDTSATASSFVSYYGKDARVDTPSLLPELRKPTLVIVAGGDEVVIGLDKKVAPLADGTRVRMKIIDGSDHTFRDLYADEAIENIDAFLKGAGH